MKKQSTTIAHPIHTLLGSIFITDKKGSIKYANTAIEERTGFSVAEVVGKKPKELWGGHMNSLFYKKLWHTIKEEKRPYIATVKNNKKSGVVHEETIHIAPIIDEDNNIAFFLEMQVAKKKQKKSFERNFIKRFSGEGTSRVEHIEWIGKMLGMEKQGQIEMKKSVKQAKKKGLSLATYIREQCITPLQEIFHARSDDVILIHAAKENRESFKDIYHKYQKDITYYFVRRLGKKDQYIAEELIQDTFVKALRHIDNFTVRNASYKTYLLRIAHNVLVNHYRKKQVLLLEDLELVIIDEENQYKRIWQKEEVLQGLRAISQIEREIVTMKYFEGMSVREIANILQKTENAIKLHLSRARKKMKKVLT
ncbi:MAG: sigma-70 family RNA polymerase sigma factor [Candidatus Magasanikbacteria bacterium]|jgi:RNA polymerase sigma-70 factor, ECF subfamily|nr:sigma-70 family RNA polymerase sigma factor [Candidatus Magasanikbacteria bacterium]MBT4221127.1 sigma-70 family RNA polymerase sigma factor [Candidatus Magasanikbacteria bacterium]MBT4350303.1 sigma-70 family RNA polymerase sigma factor [Candidatus Magasanikbacteria bacterium]MBT4541729.1 sigma-70 family RNA polymerase sigma factor [Candidatus Magasanikbacteria bacterium]MBT6253294.1 sigma-70 family RNA polymerase sigma factor [Candidatus Magasanikbacteria bacterium]